MISGEDLLAECISEVLAQNFPERKIIRSTSVYDLDPLYTSTSQLILLYRPSPDDVLFLIEKFEQASLDASVGIIVDSLDMAESLMRCLPENDVIDGIVALDMRLDVFMATVQLLVKGGEHFPSALLQRLRRRTTEPSVVNLSQNHRAEQGFAEAPHPALPTGELTLTSREIQILDLLCKGTQNKIIASKLNVSENTVKVHIRNIYKKMRVRNRTEAASRFFDLDPRRPGRPAGRN